jgi:hypothetical protein
MNDEFRMSNNEEMAKNDEMEANTAVRVSSFVIRASSFDQGSNSRVTIIHPRRYFLRGKA